MVRLKKNYSHSKGVSYEVGVQINDATEEEAEISFGTITNLKVLYIEFQHRTMLCLYLKDLELLEDRPDQPVDILRLKYNLFIGVEFYNIRFGTQYNREQFLEIVFRDRSQDSGQSSIENSMSHSNTPLHNIVSQIN